MKYRIESEGITFEAEKTQEELEEHLEKSKTGEDISTWLQITNWSKKYPII